MAGRCPLLTANGRHGGAPAAACGERRWVGRDRGGGGFSPARSSQSWDARRPRHGSPAAAPTLTKCMHVCIHTYSTCTVRMYAIPPCIPPSPGDTRPPAHSHRDCHFTLRPLVWPPVLTLFPPTAPLPTAASTQLPLMTSACPLPPLPTLTSSPLQSDRPPEAPISRWAATTCHADTTCLATATGAATAASAATGARAGCVDDRKWRR